MGVAFLFVDGIGTGKPGAQNPFDSDDLPHFNAFTENRRLLLETPPQKQNGRLFRKLDARLSVDGLPQSGTGQVALFSGENAPALIDRHFGPFPHSQTRHLLQNGSLFHQVEAMGKTAYFMNAYPEQFFRFMNKRNRWTSTTLMAKSAGHDLNTIEEVRQERAVTAELVQNAWRERLNLDVPKITAEDAADRVYKLLAEKDLVLTEYYLTDKAGHAMDPQMAQRVLGVLDRFIGRFTKRLEEKSAPAHSLVITSDHGNMEDLNVKTHTLNPVPLLVKGPAAEYLKDAESILDVTPGIVEALADS